jgi:subtilisin family serine protease
MIAGFGSAARASLRAAVAVTCLLTASWALAANGAPSTAANPITVYTSDVAAMAPGGAAARLVERARAQGEVRVIVMLRIVMRMEHTLAGREVVRQRQGLRSVQDAIASRVLGSPSDPDIVRFDFIPAMSLFVNAPELQRLLADPQVVSIQEDVPVPDLLDDTIPLIHADDVFLKGFSGTNRFVAIIDGGVAKTHPMFAGGKVVSEACYSSNIPPNTSSLCPGGATASVAPGSGVNCPLSLKGCDHGTHVAGIAAGNSSTLDGVARGAKIIAIKVSSRVAAAGCIPNTAPCKTSFQTDQIRGLQRVYGLRNTYAIGAVNISLGGGKYATACDAQNAAMKTAIDNLRAVGIATVIAAGNDGYDGFIARPACISSAIAVGNTTKNDLLAASSSHSALVKLLAPGSTIISAVPAGSSCILVGNPYCVKSGTSMAAPHVAGAFAVLEPTGTIDDILAALQCSGKPIDKRNVAGTPEVTPVLARIDLLGAFNHLKKPLNVFRTWGFGTLDDAKDWRAFRGNWTTSGGFYVQSPVATGWVATSVANCNSKLQVIARIRRVDPSPGPAYYNSGIYIKSQLDHGAETVSGYQFNFNSVPYCLINPPPNPCPPAEVKRGQANVWKVTQQNLDTGAGVAFSLLCVKNIEVTANGFNVIKVISNGASHTYYLNNKLVCTINDAAFATGAITVAAFNPTPATGHSLAVDLVQVKSLDTAPTAPLEDAAVMDATSFLEKPSDGSTPAYALARH